MTAPPPVVCVGDLMTDVVALSSRTVSVGSDTRSSVRISGGGSAANTAAWLASSGHPVAYVGRAGDDAFGRAATDELARVGVDVRVVLDPERPTGICVVVVTPDGQRSMFPDAGANAALSPDDLPADLFVGGAHLHLSGYALLTPGSRPAALAALARARQVGMTTSIDPASAGPLAVVGATQFLTWTAGADLLLANDDEARLLAGCDDATATRAAGAELARTYREVVVKLGAGGADWFRTTGGGSADHVAVPAVPVEIVDSTGAGDCFAAGFLPPWRSGADPVDSLAAGCALAAQVVTRAGARPA